MSTDLKVVVDELSSALADLVDAAQQNTMNAAEMGATLADLLEVLKAHKPGQGIGALCEAIRENRPQVSVNVSPTPVNVSIERSGYTMEFKYDGSNRITGATISPVAKP